MRELTVLPQLGFTEALSAACKKVTQFKGRSRRSEFWWTYLAVCIINLICMFIPFIGDLTSFLLGLAMIPIAFRRLHDTGRSGWWYGISIIGCVVFVIVAISLVIAALGGGASAADLSSMSSEEIVEALSEGSAMGFIGIGLLAGFIYGIILLIFLCQDSQKEENKYGPSPKYVEENADAESQDTMQTMA